MYFLARPPEREFILALSHLLRTGCPPLLTAPTWLPGTPCPADYDLIPEGTRLYTYDTQQEYTTPAIIISIASEAKPLSKSPIARQHWKIPVSLNFELTTRQDAQYIATLQSRLLRLLTEDLPTGDPDTVRATDRLTAASLAATALLDPTPTETCHVFFITDVSTQPLNYEKGHTGLEFKATITCATRTTLDPL